MVISTQTASLLVSGASVLFAAALTGVTYLYYRETVDQTEELQKSREADFKPVLKPTLVTEDGLEIYFAFENTGKGTAHEVDATWRFRNSNDEINWRIPLISSGERHKFYLPTKSESPSVAVDQILDEVDEEAKLQFEACFEDSLGNNHSTESSLDVVEVLTKRRDSGELPERDGPKQVAENVKELEYTLSKFDKTVLFEGIRGLLRSEATQRFFHVIREHEPITIGEIKGITSHDFPASSDSIRSLSEAGIIRLEAEDGNPSPYDPETTVYLADE